MSKKLKIRHRIFGDDYLEDEHGNKIELKRSLFDNPHFEIDGEKIYPEKGGKILSKKGLARKYCIGLRNSKIKKIYFVIYIRDLYVERLN